MEKYMQVQKKIANLCTLATLIYISINILNKLEITGIPINEKILIICVGLTVLWLFFNYLFSTRMVVSLITFGILCFSILGVSTSLKIDNQVHTLFSLFLMLTLLILLCINAIHIGLHLNFLDKYIYLKNYRVIILIVSFLLIVVTVIASYSSIYYAYTDYYFQLSKNNYLAYSGSNEVINKFDCLYFSVSTYFSSAYGDIIPKGEIIKIIVQTEMFISYIINVVFTAVFFVFLQKFINESIEQ
ncbi:ion channel [Heliorestis convoluta]|uniref:Potassium channel domain-containing protein n=1 Tax=Heliorestis convoluta TaxID=356322 RepID=A0A5Q2N3E4_9FIRM|nr:ion channel [Heliorestis convoluta]QGG46850.1 hypothetical protein FTV88_0672 [Heliorestis convoluta]